MDRNLRRLRHEGEILSSFNGPDLSSGDIATTYVQSDPTDCSPHTTKSAGGSFRVDQYSKPTDIETSVTDQVQ